MTRGYGTMDYELSGFKTGDLVRLDILVRDAEVPRYQPPVFEKSYEATRPVAGSNAGSVVQELSRCVEEIAAEIAADVSSL